jgi:hypothetical protein
MRRLHPRNSSQHSPTAPVSQPHSARRSKASPISRCPYLKELRFIKSIILGSSLNSERRSYDHMAEVLLTLGVASNVLQVIDFAAKVAYQTHKLVTGTDDALRENIDIEKLTRAYHDLSTDDDLSPTKRDCGSGAKLVVARQALECKTEARALLDLLEDLKIAVGTTGVRRMYQGARQTLRARRKRDKIESRRKKLQELTNQLVLAQLLELR